MAKDNGRIIYRDPKELKKHPTNVPTYGDRVDNDFVQSIRDKGIQHAIHILPDDTIISGHRRVQAAKIIGLDTVPCIERPDLTDEADILEAVIHSNKYRDKDNETKAREYAILKNAESIRAKNRQKTSTGGAEPQLRAQVPEAEKGRAADRAAAEVGMGRKTADKAATVVAVIDQATEAGDTETAESLRETLNESVAGAEEQAYRLGLAAIRHVDDKLAKQIDAGELKVSRKVVAQQRNRKNFDILSWGKQLRIKAHESNGKPRAKKKPSAKAAVKLTPAKMFKPLTDFIGNAARECDKIATATGGAGTHHNRVLTSLNKALEYAKAWKDDVK